MLWPPFLLDENALAAGSPLGELPAPTKTSSARSIHFCRIREMTQLIEYFGADGGTRTLTLFRTQDFKSCVSTIPPRPRAPMRGLPGSEPGQSLMTA
jgi:hypothetical protein